MISNWCVGRILTIQVCSTTNSPNYAGWTNILSGHGAQTATLSWFPLPSTYDISGENYGRWTPRSEAEYQRWLAAIENGGQPLPQSHWRDQLRGHKKTRKLMQNMLAFSNAFLDDYAKGVFN